MCYEPDAYYDCYESSIRQARKPHKCDACFQPIDKGDLYKYGSGIFEGEPLVEKHCGACELRVYRLHVIELTEGCPPWSSWYPAYEAIEVMGGIAQNEKYYTNEHEGPMTTAVYQSLAFGRMAAPITKEQGQTYLRMLKAKRAEGGR